MAEHEQEFVEYVVKALVEKPDAVDVKRTLDQKGVFLELTVDPEDVGKVIGKKGATINAIRALLRVLGAKYDARYALKVIEPEGYRSEQGREAAAVDEVAVNDAEPVVDNSADEPAEAQPAEANQGSETTADGNTTDEASSEVDDIRARAKEGLEDLDDLDV